MYSEDPFWEQRKEQDAKQWGHLDFLSLFLIKDVKPHVSVTRILLSSILLLTLVPTPEIHNIGSCFSSILFNLPDIITFPWSNRQRLPPRQWQELKLTDFPSNSWLNWIPSSLFASGESSSFCRFLWMAWARPPSLCKAASHKCTQAPCATSPDCHPSW